MQYRPEIELDRTDIRLLRLLQEDAGLSNLELAEKVGLTATPCARRIKRLETEGLIKGKVTLLEQSMLGLKLTAHIGITMDRHTPERFEAFESAIVDYPEVVECCVVTGQSADYLIKVVVADMAHFEQFLLGRLTRIPGVSGVHSSFELRRVIHRTALPLDGVATT